MLEKKLDFSTLEVLRACSVFCTKCVGVLRMHWGMGRYSVTKGLCSNSKSQPVFPEVMESQMWYIIYIYNLSNPMRR